MQYGFRAGRSCEHELLNVQRILLDSLSRHQVSILLFTDFIEAFDIEDHSILMMKIQHYRIRGKASQWMRSYLENSVFQYVLVFADLIKNITKKCMLYIYIWPSSQRHRPGSNSIYARPFYARIYYYAYSFYFLICFALIFFIYFSLAKNLIMRLFITLFFVITTPSIIKKGGFRHFNFDFDLWVGGDGLGMYPQHEGGFGPMRAILPM